MRANKADTETNRLHMTARRWHGKQGTIAAEVRDISPKHGHARLTSRAILVNGGLSVPVVRWF